MKNPGNFKSISHLQAGQHFTPIFIMDKYHEEANRHELRSSLYLPLFSHHSLPIRPKTIPVL